MISDEFLDAIEDFDKNSSTWDIQAFNERIIKLEGLENSESEGYFFKTLRNISEIYVKSILKDSFQWNANIGSELKEFFSQFKSLKSPLFLEFSNTSFLQTKFDIHYFRLIAETNIGRVGGSNAYDESLRSLSNMLRFFINIYLNKTLAFKPVLKSNRVHLFDPCFREKVRERNQADKDIAKELFNKEFNIKEFAFLCLKKFFPNVSWRWLGGNQFAHYMTLKIILILFEYGLWKLEEIDELLIKVYSASEILCNLETYTHRDAGTNKFQKTTINYWSRLATKCRKKFGSIILHIMIMHLDTEVMSVLPQFNIPLTSSFAGYPLYAKKSETTIENLFYAKRFKKKRLYTYFSYSLATYLIRPMHFPLADKPVDSKSLKNIVRILLGYVSEMENNMFNISLNTLQADTFSFYLLASTAPIHAIPQQYEEKFKAIITKIKMSSYGTLSHENTQFFNDIFDLFRDITSCFSLLTNEVQKLKAFQLAFLLCNIPQYILSIIDYILEMGPSEKNVSRSIKIGVQAIIAICHENNQAINSIFSNYNFNHIYNLITKDIFNGVYLVVKLFGKASTHYILEKNNEIYEKLISNYVQILEGFSLEVGEWNAGTEIKTTPDIVAAVMIYNKLFRRILRNSQQEDFKFQIIFSENMSAISTKFLNVLCTSKVKVSEELEALPTRYQKIENFLKMTNNWEGLSKDERDSVILETIYLTLTLFDQSIKKVYTEKVFKICREFFIDAPLTKFIGLVSTKYGIRLFKVVLKIFSNVMIFHQNHMLNRESLHLLKNDIYVEEYLREEQTDFNLYDQLTVFIHPIKSFIASSSLFHGCMEFLLTGYLPAIFKLFSGLLTHLTENKFKEFRSINRRKFFYYITTFLEFVLSIKELIEKEKGPVSIGINTNIFISVFKDLYTSKNGMYFFRPTLNPELDTFREIGYTLMDSITCLYLYNESKIPHISELVRYNYYNFEESIFGVMKSKLEFMLKFRNEIKIPGNKNIVLWDKTKKTMKAFKDMQADTNAAADNLFYQVKNFDFELPDDENTKFVGTDKRKKSLKLTKLEIAGPFQILDWSKTPSCFYIEKVIVYLKERYRFMKTYFLDKNNKNQIFIVFRLDDCIKKNVQIFVDYFFNQMKLMDISFENLDENFFTNGQYFSLFILMDNLVRTSKAYRKTFYDKIQTNEGSLVMEKIWKLHRMLLDYCLYSTFLDSAWKQNFTSYFLISNFIQNLCEDNFYLFKRWFCKPNNIEGIPDSLLETYHSFLETAFKHTELAQYNREELSISDKPENFFVYNRIVEGMTEFINGGKSLGQEMIYDKRIDIWVGIIMRIVDDVDSTFYILKYNIVLYVSAMLEGLDTKIIEFMASNFSVNRTFRLILRLLKKLYIRQYLLKKSKRVNSKGISQKDSIFEITQEDEGKYHIGSIDILLDYYKKYNLTFSDHVIMNTLVGLYSFVRAMSTCVLRYKNFLEEITGMEKATMVDKNQFVNETYDMESIIMWHFLKSIIVDLEILFKDRTLEEKTPPKLYLHHFKKLPICFFLTESIKQNFLSDVNIDSIDLKHDRFYGRYKQHVLIMHDFRNLYKKSKFLFYASTEGAFRIYMFILFLTGVAINIIFLVAYDQENNPNKFLQWNPVTVHVSVTVLAVINSCLGFTFLLFWFLFSYPTVKRIKWEDYYILNKRSKKPPLSAVLRINIWKSVIMKKHFRTFFMHTILSLMGMFVSPFFYSLLLMMIVDLSLLIFSVINSFIKNYDKLAYTLLMIVVVLNFFSFLAADVFETDFAQNLDTKTLCSTYFTCLMNVVNIGLRSGNGIAEKMTLNSNNASNKFYGRFFFDVMFFILINIILLGMFFGIIVDSFKEYRDKLDTRENDESKICFTCGLPNDRLEKAGIYFKDHVQYHDIWKYLFYMKYLDWKPLNSYDGVDLYVKENMDSNNRRAWMPIGQTMGFKIDKEQL